MDKECVRARFSRSLDSYDHAATVQRSMARRLCELLPARPYPRVLEVGCGTGVCTAMLASSLTFAHFTANDLVPQCAAHIRRILPQATFMAGDIDSLELTEDYALIVSNACLQWSKGLAATLTRLLARLSPGGVLACSLFGPENFREVQEIFGAGLAYPSLQQLRQYMAPHTLLALEEERRTLCFDSLLDILRHMRDTGVNAFGGGGMSTAALRRTEQRYRERFGLRLTYHPVYLVAQKR